MEANRLEAFSDGVLAIIITIMVLEMKVPHGSNLSALAPLLPVFLSYLLSFIYVGIYWNNHHHLLKACLRINGSIMWANLHLLFWLSLLPFATGWMGENHYTPLPSALYGAVLLMSAVAYVILQRRIIVSQRSDAGLAASLAGDFKGKVSLLLYIVAIALSFFLPWAAGCLYLAVALLWLIPDRRISRLLEASSGHAGN